MVSTEVSHSPMFTQSGSFSERLRAGLTPLVDNWPRLLRPHRKKFAVLVCFLSFCAGLPMCTQVRRAAGDT